MSRNENNRIGILAGWGRYPIIIAEALRRQGAEIVGLGVKDHVDPAFADLCSEYRQIGVAQLGAAVRFYKRHAVTRATMAGKIHKKLIFEKFLWIRHIPDFLFLKTFYPHFITGSRDRKDDTMLGTIVDAFDEHGIQFGPATDFAPELLVKQGMIAGRALGMGQNKDVEFGWKLASEMGRLDVGQSVCVKGLRRAGRRGGGGHGRVHPSRGGTVSFRWIYGREDRQATAGHAIRCSYRRGWNHCDDARSWRHRVGHSG